MEIEIVRAKLKDAEEILTLQKLAFQSEAELYQDWRIPPLTQTLSQLEDEFQYKIFRKETLSPQVEPVFLSKHPQ